MESYNIQVLIEKKCEKDIRAKSTKKSFLETNFKILQTFEKAFELKRFVSELSSDFFIAEILTVW